MNLNVKTEVDIRLLMDCEDKAAQAVELGVIKRSQEQEYVRHLFKTKKGTPKDPSKDV